MRAPRLAQALGVAIVPRCRLGGRSGGIARGIPFRQRTDQRLLDRARLVDQVECTLRGVEGKFEGARGVDGIDRLPLLVVVWAGGVSAPPPCHGTAGIISSRLLEAANRLFVIEGVAPDETAIEPHLRFRGAGGDR